MLDLDTLLVTISHRLVIGDKYLKHKELSMQNLKTKKSHFLRIFDNAYCKAMGFKEL